MKDKLSILKDNLHTISNKLMIINRTFDIFAKQFPEHRLTKISQTALDNFNELIKESKDIIADMAQEHSSSEQESSENTFISNWYRNLDSRIEIFSEMYPIRLKINPRGEATQNQENQKNLVLDEILFNVLELVTNHEGTELNIDLLSKGDNLTLIMTDNSINSITDDSFEIESIKIITQRVSARLESKSIRGVGNQIKLFF